MNIETRAREAAESLRSATFVDVEDGLARLHRTHQRRTAGKLVAAAAVIATAVGVIQVQRDQEDAAPARYDGPPVLISASGGDWEDPVTGETGAQSYPHFVSADPDTARFLQPDAWNWKEWTTYSPGSREPLAVYPCGIADASRFNEYCGEPAILGPGDDELTMIYPQGVVVVGPGSLVRRELGPFLDADWRRQVHAENGEPHAGLMEWAPDDEQLALTRRAGYSDRASVQVVVRDAGSGEETLVYDDTAALPSWAPSRDHDSQWGSFSIKALAWSPDSSRLAFVVQSFPGSGSGEDRYFDWRLFVADLRSGEVEQIAEVGSCLAIDDFGGWVCYENPWIAWAPDGERLSVLANGELATYARDGELLDREETTRRGPLVWLGSE